MSRKSFVQWSLIAFACSGLSILAALFGYIAHKESLPAKVHAYLAGRTAPCCIDKVREKLEIGGQDGVFTRIDAIRNFVHTNSVSATHDFEQDLHPYDTGGVIQALLDVSEGRIEPIGLMCSSRSNAMTGLLDQMGMASRQVHVFSEENGSHTFLEVRNPDDGRWSIQDPDYGLFWIEKITKRRLGLGEMLSTPLDGVLPCRSVGDCDWKYAANLEPYFGAAIYFNFDATPLILVNHDRFDLNKVLQYHTPPGTIVEFAQNTWGADFGDPILSVIHGGP